MYVKVGYTFACSERDSLAACTLEFIVLALSHFDFECYLGIFIYIKTSGGGQILIRYFIQKVELYLDE